MQEKDLLMLIDKCLSQTDRFLDLIERKGSNAKEFIFRAQKQVVINEEDKPQNGFKDSIDNSEDPFIPKLTTKQCSSIPLSQAILECRKSPQTFFKYNSSKEKFEFEHPYLQEISALKSPSLQKIAESLSHYQCQKVMGSNFEFIETPLQFSQLVAQLQG